MKVLASPFDSELLRYHVVRFEPEASDCERDLDDALGAARSRGADVAFLRTLAGSELDRVLRARHETPVDILVTSTLQRDLVRPTSHVPAGVVIEHHDVVSDPSDRAAIIQLTSEIESSHLHADPRLPRARTDELYAAWARNDLDGRAGHFVLARMDGVCVGYIALVVGAASIVIDLVAVAKAQQGRGVGSALVGSTVSWIGERDIAATVGTQANNPALALYRKHGFVPTAELVTYHLWVS